MPFNPIEKIKDVGEKIVGAGTDLVKSGASSAKDLITSSFDPNRFGEFVSGIYDKGLGVYKDFFPEGASSALTAAGQIAAAKYGYDQQYKGVQEQNKTNLKLVRRQNITAQKIANSANKMSQANAREQMAFQDKQSSTAHQREVSDLKAAGLNPILSGTGGMGAQSGAGASGSVTAAPVAAARVENERGSAISSAMQMMTAVAQALKTNADREYVKEVQTPNTQASTRNTDVDTSNKNALNTKINQETNNLVTINENLKKTGRLTDAQIKQTKQTIANLQESFKALKMRGDIDKSEYGKYMEMARRATENIGNLPNLLNAVKNIVKR